MKGSFTFLLILMVTLMSLVAKNAPEVKIIRATPTQHKSHADKAIGGLSKQELALSATSVPFPEHIWPPKLGTSYENEKLGGVGNRFDIGEPQIFVSFAYRNMEDGLPCTIAVSRDGEANGEMTWLWDTKMRSSQGRMVADIMSIIENLRPGDYVVEVSVHDQVEQRVEFELF